MTQKQLFPFKAIINWILVNLDKKKIDIFLWSVFRASNGLIFDLVAAKAAEKNIARFVSAKWVPDIFGVSFSRER